MISYTWATSSLTINALSLFLYMTGFTTDWQAVRIIKRHCYHYKNLSYGYRKISYITIYGLELCDSQLPQGRNRFVGAAGTKMPTTRVPAYRCGADWSGWLADAHPTVEDGKVKRKVCLSDCSTGCKYVITISVKNCGSYFIYKLYPPACYSRYCGIE